MGESQVARTSKEGEEGSGRESVLCVRADIGCVRACSVKGEEGLGPRQGSECIMDAEQESSGIDGLKQILIDTLENQGRLDAIKADVRATVFAALNTKLDATGDEERVAKRKTNSKVSQLLRSEPGTKALEGVVELLR